MSVNDIARYVYVTLCVACILFIPIICIRYGFRRKKLNTSSLKHELVYMAFFFYCICLYQITALRFGGLGWNLEAMVARDTRVNILPFVILWGWTKNGVWWHLFYNVIGNCIWFVPMGLMLPAISRRYRGRPLAIIQIGMVTSISIELLQYVLCTGVTDIDDVIFNTIGTAIGYFCWYLFDKVRTISY